MYSKVGYGRRKVIYGKDYKHWIHVRGKGYLDFCILNVNESTCIWMHQCQSVLKWKFRVTVKSQLFRTLIVIIGLEERGKKWNYWKQAFSHKTSNLWRSKRDFKEPPNQISNTVYLHHKAVSYAESDHFDAPLNQQWEVCIH